MSEQTTTVILKERDALRAAVIETCPRLVNESDADCLRRTVSELRADLESETRWAKQYHDDWIAARDELERVKAELVEAQARLIAGDVYEKLDAVNYWKTRAEVDQQSLNNVLKVSKSKDKIIVGLNQKIVSANRRAEQAEAELGAAINQRNIAQRFVNENADLIEYWRDLFKRANAEKRAYRRERNLAIATGTTLLQQRDRARDALREWQEGREVNALADYADTEIRKRAEQAEADARATAATTSKMLRSNYENELIAKYLEAAK